MDPLLTYHEARLLLLDHVPDREIVNLPLGACLGRVAASDLIADCDLPQFRKSFMDGYALRSDDVGETPVSLTCTGEVAAGQQAEPRIRPGECVAIMTGAPVPSDADAVQRVEDTTREGDQVTFLRPVSRGAHLSPRGSEVRGGDVVVEAGRLLGPPEIGVLATFGHAVVPVWAPPRVAIVPTGNELVEITQSPGPAQIRNSNAHMIEAQCRQLGLETTLIAPAADTPEDTLRALNEARSADLILFMGGVSMGERDYVHRVLAESGTELVFHKAAIKPGKPLLVGRDGSRLVMGLPGNPVSSFVTFELFVRPAVQRWMGLDAVGLRIVFGEVSRDISHRAGRLFFMPARTGIRDSKLVVDPVKTRGSADLTAFARADSLMLVPQDRPGLEAGEKAKIMLLEGRQP